MLPYKVSLDRIKESERVVERLNHHIQRYGLQIATCSHNIPEEKMGFHVFGDTFRIPDEDVKTQMFRYMSDNYAEISPIVTEFLKVKGQEQCDYVEYMSRDYAKADQLALYLCARRFQVHLALITKNRIWFTFQGEGDISDCDIVLVYKGANVWKNTTTLTLPPPLHSHGTEKPVPSRKKKSKYEEDPDYIPRFSDSDTLSEGEIKEEKKPDVVFPLPQPVIDLVSEEESDLPTIAEDPESDSDETVIYDSHDYVGDNNSTKVLPSPGLEVQKGKQKPVVKVIPTKSYHYGVKGAAAGKKCSVKNCKEVFHTPQELQKHLDSAHSKTRQRFHCTYPNCDEVFATDAERSNHMFSTHGLEFKCSRCFKTFSDKRNLNKHVKRHNPANLKFQCSICPYKALFESELRLHMSGHADLRPFKCKYEGCPKDYRTKGELTKHIQTHHLDNPWVKCDHCPQQFRGQKLYRIHLRTHNDPRFQCELCGEKFRHYQHLTYHKGKCTTIVE